MPNIIRHPERQDVYSLVTGRIVADFRRIAAYRGERIGIVAASYGEIRLESGFLRTIRILYHIENSALRADNKI